MNQSSSFLLELPSFEEMTLRVTLAEEGEILVSVEMLFAHGAVNVTGLLSDNERNSVFEDAQHAYSEEFGYPGERPRDIKRRHLENSQ